MTHLINHKPPLQHTWGLFPLILHHFDVLCARLNESWMQGDDKLTSFRESRSYILKEEWNTESRAEFISSTWILKNTWKSDVSWILALKSKAKRRSGLPHGWCFLSCVRLRRLPLLYQTRDSGSLVALVTWRHAIFCQDSILNAYMLTVSPRCHSNGRMNHVVNVFIHRACSQGRIEGCVEDERWYS